MQKSEKPTQRRAKEVRQEDGGRECRKEAVRGEAVRSVQCERQ